MLYCRNLTVRASRRGPTLVEAVSVTFRERAMNALIGPSGCGKTTLVKGMLGIVPASGEAGVGGARFKGTDDLIGRVGFVPQFSIAHPKLTVEECLRDALRLFVAGTRDIDGPIDRVLRFIGLSEHRTKRIEALSGGQLRRIGLGLELMLDPACLVCDEVTSGLDPNSEDAILAMLRQLVEERGKTFINIIHNLAKLELFDTVTVLNRGRLAFHGTYPGLLEHFNIPDALHLYDRLNESDPPPPCPNDEAAIQAIRSTVEVNEQPPHARPSTDGLNETTHGIDRARDESATGDREMDRSATDAGAANKHAAATVRRPPNAICQLVRLLLRRFRLFFRDTGYLGLTAAITVGFPIMVVIFALDGLPQIESLALSKDSGLIEQFTEQVRLKVDHLRTSQLVTGLIMFQVILLTLMGSNNGAREIASERTLYEKERLSGLSPTAYIISKFLFCGTLAVLQGLYMTAFVKYICGFPGDFAPQALILSLVCASMTWVCLGFSALFPTPERASLVSIYLVGFQLPLSGVVLALPEWLTWVCRPFINTYWGWAGYLTTLRDSRIYDAWQQSQAEWAWLPAVGLAVGALLAQGLCGLAACFVGCWQRRW